MLRTFSSLISSSSSSSRCISKMKTFRPSPKPSKLSFQLSPTRPLPPSQPSPSNCRHSGPRCWRCGSARLKLNSKPAILADLTKFNHVVAALDNVIAGEVEAIILSPPTNDKYATLKATLINAFGKTQASKDMELLSYSGLGDRKPSSLLGHMEFLNADRKTLLHALFRAQLSMEVRRVLAASPMTELKTLAKEADAIMEAGSFGFSTTGIAGIHKLMPSSTGTTSRDLCFYHIKFGKEAMKCNQRGCKMAYLVSTSASTSSSPSPASGNGQAGR